MSCLHRENVLCNDRVHIKGRSRTLGLANHFMDLNVDNLFIRSVRSHGRHTGGACDAPEEGWTSLKVLV